MTGIIMPLRERDASTIQAAADAFLSSPRYANPNTRRGYTGALDAQPPLGRGQRGGTCRAAGATLGTVRPGDLEPQPRRRGVVCGRLAQIWFDSHGRSDDCSRIC